MHLHILTQTQMDKTHKCKELPHANVYAPQPELEPRALLWGTPGLMLDKLPEPSQERQEHWHKPSSHDVDTKVPPVPQWTIAQVLPNPSLSEVTSLLFHFGLSGVPSEDFSPVVVGGT